MRLAVSSLCLASAVIAPVLGNSQEKLRILDRPVLTVEQLCNPEGKGAATLILRNGGTAAVALRLSAGDLSSKSPARQLSLRPTLTVPEGRKTLEANQEVEVQVAIGQLFEAGDWESTIRNDDAEVGTLRILRTSVPFSITLDAAPPDAPELTFQKGKPGHFRLKNRDPREYPIAWEYSVNGHVLRSADGDRLLTIPPNGEREVVFTPPREWFEEATLLKNGVSEGHLTLNMVAPGCGAPSNTPSPVSKTFNVKTHLAIVSGGWREFWQDLIVFVVLVLGGIFSLVLNFMLPNQMRRAKVKQQLSHLGGQVGNLSYALASRLRVQVGLEQRLINDRLRNLTWTSGDFAGEIQSIDQAASRLGTRLQFLDRLGATRTNFDRMRLEALPPSMTFAMDATFEKVVEIGEKADPTDEDVQTAQALIKSVQDQLDGDFRKNAGFVTELSRRLKDAKKNFDPAHGRLGKTTTCKRIRQLLPGPFELVSTTPEAAPPSDQSSLIPSELIRLDRALVELGMIQDYVEMVEGTTDIDDFLRRMQDHEVELLKFLRLESMEALYWARLLTRQMQDGYFKADIQDEVTQRNVRISLDHGEVRQYEPCEFRLEFLKHPLNTAYARQEWTCQWTFSRDDEPTLVEEGWIVTHYFQKGEPYTVNIALTHNLDSTRVDVPSVAPFPDGKIEVQGKGQRLRRVVRALLRRDFTGAVKEWRIRRGRNSLRALEYLRLAMALLIALFGLIAGGKEQLLKLDFVPALLAVFLLGFGADQIKNLLTQRPSLTTQNSPH